MIYGAEIMKYKTLGEMAAAAKINTRDYNWLISEQSVFIRRGEKDIFDEEYTWLTGEEFAEMIKNDGYHFIWCMASAFPKTVTLGEVLKYELPYADGNAGFWVDDVKFQTPLTKIELVILDGWYGFMLTDDVRHRDNFLAVFPEAFDLVEDNRITNARAEVIRRVIADSDITFKTDKPEWEIYRQIFGIVGSDERTSELCERCRSALAEKGLLVKKKGDIYYDV